MSCVAICDMQGDALCRYENKIRFLICFCTCHGMSRIVSRIVSQKYVTHCVTLDASLPVSSSYLVNSSQVFMCCVLADGV